MVRRDRIDLGSQTHHDIIAIETGKSLYKFRGKSEIRDRISGLFDLAEIL